MYMHAAHERDALLSVVCIAIDTFSDMRGANNDREDNINNMCFICSMPREKFERNGVNFKVAALEA